ncbi:MAG: GntR family transcriptional regulator [Burkholderiaceae bacterium]
MKSGTTLVSRLVGHYSEWIGRGLLRAGDRLPSVRQCALLHACRASRCQRAYDRLVASGLVESHVRGSGARCASS